MSRRISGALDRSTRKGHCQHPDCDKPVGKGRRTFCSHRCGRLFFYQNNWVGQRVITWLCDRGRCRLCTVLLDCSGPWGTYLSMLKSDHFRPVDLTLEWDRDYFGPLSSYGDIEKLFVHAAWHCDKSCLGERAEIDHIRAISLGGDPLDLDNLRTLCSSCHKTKTAEDRAMLAEQNRPEEPEPVKYEGLEEFF